MLKFCNKKMNFVYIFTTKSNAKKPLLKRFRYKLLNI